MITYLTTCPAILSRLIQWITKSKVSHTVIREDSSYLVLHSTATGVHYSHINHLFKSYIIVYAYKIKKGIVSIKQQRELFKEMAELLDTRYDIPAIIGFLLSIIGKKLGIRYLTRNTIFSSNSIFCSELWYIYIKKLIEKEYIRDILKGYKQERFSPEDVRKVIVDSPDIFEGIKYEKVARNI